MFASPTATFRLPDVLRGTAAIAGGFPRLLRTIGLQRANLLALTAYTLHPQEARDWGIVIEVVDGGRQQLLNRVIETAKSIASHSPDSVIVSRKGVREGWNGGSVEENTLKTGVDWAEWLMTGENVKEGMKAFAEKRPPKWKNSRL